MPIPKDYVAPTPVSAKVRAFQQIQEWIIDGTLQPGEKLNDQELAQAIGVSRTPVREALQMLAMQNFITMKPGVATYVNETKREDLALILQPSAALQGVAAEIAATKITVEMIDRLESLNLNLKNALERNDFFASLKYDEQFHNTIIHISENPYLEAPLINLMAHVRRQFFLESITLSFNSVLEHQKLIEALKEHDSRAALNAAHAHWHRSVTDLLTQL